MRRHTHTHPCMLFCEPLSCSLAQSQKAHLFAGSSRGRAAMSKHEAEELLGLSEKRVMSRMPGAKVAGVAAMVTSLVPGARGGRMAIDWDESEDE